jgi:hypothetical protein
VGLRVGQAVCRPGVCGAAERRAYHQRGDADDRADTGEP